MQKVVCAIIVDHGSILVCQRGPGQKLEGEWEFPGGKVDPDESPEQALYREIQEELALDITIQDHSPWFPHTYPWGEMELKAFVANIKAGQLTLNEHSQYRWVLPPELPQFDWCAADIPVVQWFISTLEQPGP